MRRQDVKHGVEYAVRQGSYGQFARVLIIGDAKREIRAGTDWRPPKYENCLEGKLLDGEYTAERFSQRNKRGSTIFVRGRDVSHEWTVEVERQDRAAAEKARIALALQDDRAERHNLDRRMAKLGITWTGLNLDPDQYRYAGKADCLSVRREALTKLVEMAEAGRQYNPDRDAAGRSGVR